MMDIPHWTYQHNRQIALGAAEALPAEPTGAQVFDLRTGHDDQRGEIYDSLLMLATGADLAYSLYFWNRTNDGGWVLHSSDTLAAGVPATVVFPYEGAKICVLKTAITAANVELYVTPKQVGLAPVPDITPVSFYAEHIEDTPAYAGDTGVGLVSVKNSELAQTEPWTTPDGDYTFVMSDPNGALWVDPVANIDNYTAVRTLAGAAADSEPPLAASFVSLGTPANSFVSLSYSITSVANSPTAVTFRTWRNLNGTIDKIDEFTVQATELPFTATRQSVLSSGSVYVTATFTGGTVPTVTGTINGRLISPGSIGVSRSDFKFDTSRRVEVRPAGYDATPDAQKVYDVAPFYTNSVIDVIANATNVPAGPTYYPAATGLDMLNYTDVSFELNGASGITTLTFEASNDSAFTTPQDVSKAGYDLKNNALGTASWTDPQTIVDFDNLNTRYIRVKVIGDGSNTLKITARRKS